MCKSVYLNDSSMDLKKKEHFAILGQVTPPSWQKKVSEPLLELKRDIWWSHRTNTEEQL